MITYQYSKQIDPPGPFVNVTVGAAGFTNTLSNLPAQLDSGADVTVVPLAVIAKLGLIPAGEVMAHGFFDEAERCQTYAAIFRIHDLDLVEAEVLATSRSYILLGRAVLHRFRITLDGPKQKLEIG